MTCQIKKMACKGSKITPLLLNLQ